MTVTQFRNKRDLIGKQMSKTLNEMMRLNNQLSALEKKFRSECKHVDKNLEWRSRGREDDYGSYDGSDRWLYCKRCESQSKSYWHLEYSNVPDLSSDRYKEFTGRKYKGNIR